MEDAKRLAILREAAIKDFPNVLEKLPLEIFCNKGDLEFEFDLPWDKLKELLDKNCEYETNNQGKIKITSKEKVEIEESTNNKPVLTDEEWLELRRLFSKKRGDRGRGYVSIKQENFPKSKRELLKKAYECGVVGMDFQKNIKIIRWFRKKIE